MNEGLNMECDKEDKYILDALESGKMNIDTPSKKEIESIKTDADATGRFLNSPTVRRTWLSRISFQTALLFAPLAYAFHHIEEHIFFNFRVWRLKYFPDNNHLTTETVFCIKQNKSLD